MFQWIISNIWTIIICAVLIAIVSAIIISMVKKKKQGKSLVCSCGNCKTCPPAINNKRIYQSASVWNTIIQAEVLCCE